MIKNLSVSNTINLLSQASPELETHNNNLSELMNEEIISKENNQEHNSHIFDEEF